MDDSLYRYPHILLPSTSTTERFTSPKSGPRQGIKTPLRDRQTHSKALLRQIDEVREAAEQLDRERKAWGIDAQDGICIQFKSDPEFDLKFESLDYSPSGIELLAVKEFESSIYATVFVPEGKISYFIKKIEKYSTEETEKGKFKNKDLVESIAEIRKATLESLWTDDRSFFPKEGEKIWWEVWIRSGKPMLDFFLIESVRIGLEISSEKIIFPDRTVLLAYGDTAQVSRSVDLLNCIAEVRKAKDTPEIFTSMTSAEQKEWVEEAVGRITPAPADAVAICLLDTGINKGHPLIDPHLSENNMHAYNPDWLVTDHDGHGTEMAGLALYGDLMEIMANSGPITLGHRLESVKILPPPPDQNDPKLYGAITKECVARAEIAEPYRQRVISTAVTSSINRGRGQPCSWSAEIDQLCSGAEDSLKRLFIVSAGNTDPQQRHLYPKSNETDGIHDPAQAWNVLSVGAYTNKVDIDQNEYPGWKPIAPAGDLSPSSCTSMVWQRKKWPIKPDVVFEGGNSAKVPIRDEADKLDSLQLLTTHWRPIEKLLTVSGDTSAATALAARMAASLQAEYPEFWPETIRALLVHSAEWSPAMKARFNPLNDNKENLLRYCGFGVPDFMKALRSAANSLTLIAQDELQPFDKIEGRYKTCDMHLHSIPWPEDVLQSLGETDVDMKVTLSYFIEPNPASRGWIKKYNYASYGLRFEVKRPLESLTHFMQRINKADRDEEYNRTSGGSSSNWSLGINLRSKGSLHSDNWSGTASELSQCGYVAVYPVTGWWKERHQLGRWNRKARYSLIVSISTPRIDVDLYTPIINQIKPAIQIEWTIPQILKQDC
ncbi:MAG: hypothetical protein DRP09_16930 [Candidatus Thorarchaeota archaeon]|nr:MAG: hypothetical protein DRP09_16930 [Candidatus Thorarchaeota archaeon]